jgi:predicted ribosome quality control (RQC) complex YloA/Tae2 family protein
VSLNCREIDLVLTELKAEGSLVQGIIQPTYDSLVLELYRPGRPFAVFISLSPRGCRIHGTGKAILKPPRPLRFMEFLKARVLGAHIEAIRQLGGDRIVRIDFQREGENTRFYVRLWSNAANAILTDSSGTILDAMFRRPKRGESRGEPFKPEEDSRLGSPPPPSLAPRDFPGEGSLSSRIEAFYDTGTGLLSLEELRRKVESRYSEALSRVDSLVSTIRAKLSEGAEAERLKEIGDVLLALPSVSRVSEWVDAENFHHPGETLRIRLRSDLSIPENAEAYYRKSKKLKASMEELKSQLDAALAEGKSLETERSRLLEEEDPLRLDRFLRLGGGKKAESKPLPGIVIESRGWTLIVGKAAKDNDELLRRHVRGNDYWLHARDYPGAYVFIKGRKDKTPPLDVLLDAANLALYHSKARASGKCDVHYTMVKYLRRVKGGPIGLVIPTQEKNLSVTMDPLRLARLKDGDDEEA